MARTLESMPTTYEEIDQKGYDLLNSSLDELEAEYANMQTRIANICRVDGSNLADTPSLLLATVEAQAKFNEIQKLKARIAKLKVVEIDSDETTVNYEDEVTYRITYPGEEPEEETRKIVGTIDTNSNQLGNAISRASSKGKAIFGQKVGYTTTVTLPGGKASIEILSISKAK